jgi:glyoxylase-like metal-dependent hydrolase (beta-lactamase superfamily II)
MILRPFLHEPTACASYLVGCLSERAVAVVDPHVELAGAWLGAADRAGAGVAFAHHPLAEGELVELGNTRVRALATPGHAPAHTALVVSDLRRGTDEPWLVFTGDSLLAAVVGRPDLHAHGEPMALARLQQRSVARLPALPGHLLVHASHFGGPVCGRALSANPFSTIGFGRLHNRAAAGTDPERFARGLLEDLPPAPPDQAAIVARNRRGRVEPAA